MNQFDVDPYQFTTFHRDSRNAFGVRFEVEKPNRDWMWFVASVALVIAIAVVAI